MARQLSGEPPISVDEAAEQLLPAEILRILEDLQVVPNDGEDDRETGKMESR